jgi:hypothetical protein
MLCPLGPFVVALPAESVTDISELRREAAPPEERAPLDLAKLYGVPLAAGTERRRVLRLAWGERVVSVLVGADVVVHEVWVAPIALPAFLAALGTRARVCAFVPYRDGYAYVLDVPALCGAAGEARRE